MAKKDKKDKEPESKKSKKDEKKVAKKKLPQSLLKGLFNFKHN